MLLPTNDYANSTEKGYLTSLVDIEQTRSFLHLHLALDATDLDLTKVKDPITVGHFHSPLWGTNRRITANPPNPKQRNPVL